MRKQFLLFAWLCCCSYQIIAQDDLGPNLVPNPGFEKLRRALPPNDLDGSVAFRNSLDKWMSPSKTTPDLLFQVNDGSGDNPKSGESMVGILSHNPSSKRSDTYREYIQVKLDKKLVQGKTYLLEYWVKRSSKARLASNNIGAALTMVPVLNSDYNPLLKIEPDVNAEEIINPNETEWIKISEEIIADRNFQFLIIGNFYSNKSTKFKEKKAVDDQYFNNAYYFIDDVSIRQVGLEPEIVEAPVEETLATKSVEVGQVIRLNNIFFETAKWDLLPASFVELDQLLSLLNNHTGLKIAIHGHTDSRGGIRYNELLSENRAKSVFEYLFERGIDIDRIQFQGFGETNPEATNDTVEGRQLNRRVEFVVLEVGDNSVEVDN